MGGTFLDVRAPLEFDSGALPGAVNLPILNNEERHDVGLRYKTEGPGAALDLGHQLVQGAVKEERLEQWQKLISAHPDLMLYCFRGGQRSSLTQKWLAERGVQVQRLSGGYKEARHFLMTLLEEVPSILPLMVISGHTGSGKTFLLRSVAAVDSTLQFVDLEKLANHRGSAFGREVLTQPSQSQFENNLAVALWKAQQCNGPRVWIEDEARTIGRITLPAALFKELRSAPLVVIDENRLARAQLILREYVMDAHQAWLTVDEESAWENLTRALLEPIHRISKKLGGELTARTLKLIKTALACGPSNYESHLEWIDLVLEHYYDPYYELHMQRQAHRITFRGSRQAIMEYLGYPVPFAEAAQQEGPFHMKDPTSV